MRHDLDDTIAAISTPVGEGGIGIVRLSGKNAMAIVERFFKSKKQNVSLVLAPSHTVVYGHIVDLQGEIVDEVLASVFRSPHSYTAQDMVEISAHGSMVSLRKILQLALKHGARHAEPGEFTKRAFLNGRIDLTQAEAVLDTIRAKTDRALKMAVAQLQGSLSQEIHGLKDKLMGMYAHMEAYLDFPDEHLEVYSSPEFLERFLSAEQHVEKLLASYSKGEIFREGVLAVIIGRPNVGKSSLLNVLLSRDRAIVSEIPGTTRDALEELIELDGVPIKIVDTAGVWDNQDPLTQAAVARTKAYISTGDIFLYVIDAPSGVLDEDRNTLSELKGRPVILVVNKTDLVPPNSNGRQSENFKLENTEPVFISAKTKDGIELLEKKIVSTILKNVDMSSSASITRLRHRQALEDALAALQKSRETFAARESLEFVVFDLKRSLDALKEIIGEIYTDDLLKIIFSEFCIGK